MGVQIRADAVRVYIHLLLMCSVSTHGERAGLVNLILAIGSMLECS